MKIPVIIGPTASGKTDLALQLARQLRVEIVCADSRKIYRYLDIGTAKPTPYQQKIVKFHMIDICDPDQYFSAGDYCQAATMTIKKILKKGVIPLVVGGTGLYIDTIFNPLPPLPKPDSKLRKEIAKQEKELGLEELYKQLKKYDPEWAERINPNDRQRIRRGLEVLKLTGKPISELIKQETYSDFIPIYIGILLDKEDLERRIQKRLKRMLNDGLIFEVRWLLNIGFSAEINALKTIGYKEIISFLKGSLTAENLEKEIFKKTKLFAKRQMTWFKKYQDIPWFTPPFDLDEIIRRIKN